jgi:hypothetical protein
VVLPALVELAPDAVDQRHAVLLDQEVEEVGQQRVGAAEHARQPVLLLVRREVGREEEHLKVAVGVERVRELGELLVEYVEALVADAHLEQRLRVDGRDLFHRRR